jgi:hypothetical protein
VKFLSFFGVAATAMIVRPIDTEDAKITAAALTDPDNLPLTDEELR